MYIDEFKHQLPDLDSNETTEWIESLDQVVKCTVFLADIQDWPAFNEVYVQFFKHNLPARSALAASGLALGARVEVECIAYIPPPAQ